MSNVSLANRVKVSTTTTGTGTVTLGSAFSNAYCTFAEGGITDGQTVRYEIIDGTDFEIGTGVYTASGTTLSRASVTLSKISGTAGTSKINLSGSAVVSIVGVKEDLYYQSGTDVAIADGGTGQSTATAGFDALSPVTTRGDLIYRNASNNARLAVGTSQQVLGSNGTDPTWVSASPVGIESDYDGHTVPSGWLECYGQNVSRSTYSLLFAALIKSATITVTIASPAVVTWTAHGLIAGDKVRFTTTGALPTGITASTDYYVISTGLATDSFRISATVEGTAINTSGSQSGVHTGIHAPHGVGDGSTTFTIPDRRGYVTAGRDNMGGTAASRLTGLSGGIDGRVMGVTGGEQSHTDTTTEMPLHSHNTTLQGAGGGGVVGTWVANNGNGSNLNVTNSGSGGAHNNVQPSAVTRKIIFAGA